jgi:APA family basic amino acid/polyamine antiporter
LALGEYVYSPARKWVGIAAIFIMTVINVLGIQRTAGMAVVLAGLTTTFVLVAVVLGIVLPVQPIAEVRMMLPFEPSWAIVTAASIFFFAFAGYARVATLGTEVRDAKRNIPRAIGIVMSVVTLLYFGVLFVLKTWLRTNLAMSDAPFVVFFDQIAPGLGVVVLPVVVAATLGSILALLAGVSRTAAEMATDRELPAAFKARNRFGSPWLAEFVIAAGASTLVLVADDLAWAIGFSSFSVLFYYAVAHLSVCYMRAAGVDEYAAAAPRGVLARFSPIMGIILCLLLALYVPGPAFSVSAVILIAAVVARTVLRALLRGRFIN